MNALAVAAPPRPHTALAVDVTLAGVRAPLSRAHIAALAELVLRAEGVRDAMLSITLVTNGAIAKLNRQHLGHAGPTDVIAFALTTPSSPKSHVPRPTSAVVGDIYIAPAVARANAKRFGNSVTEELARLVIHGTLHVLGWDHPDGEGRVRSPMWTRQERVLRSWQRRTARA